MKIPLIVLGTILLPTLVQSMESVRCKNILPLVFCCCSSRYSATVVPQPTGTAQPSNTVTERTESQASNQSKITAIKKLTSVKVDSSVVKNQLIVYATMHMNTVKMTGLV